MYKKICLYLLIVLGCLPSMTEGHYVEGAVRIGAYFPTYDKADKFFANGAPIYELRVAGHFGSPWQMIPWKVWAQASYLPGNANHTHIKGVHLFPISMGLEYGGALCGGDYTIGAGPLFAWLHFKDTSVWPHRVIAKKQMGAVIKTSYNWCRYGVIAGLFADYMILNMHANKHAGSSMPRRLCFNGFVVGFNLGKVF